jgi:hypothetical protein
MFGMRQAVLRLCIVGRTEREVFRMREKFCDSCSRRRFSGINFLGSKGQSAVSTSHSGDEAVRDALGIGSVTSADRGTSAWSRWEATRLKDSAGFASRFQGDPLGGYRSDFGDRGGC